MIPLSFDVCLLIMSTSAALSVNKRMHLFDIFGPQMCNAITTGNNSRVAMFRWCHERGHLPYNQCLPKTAPYPLEPAESLYSSKVLDVSQTSLKKKDFPLKESRNCSHTSTSFLASTVRRIWCVGRLIPLVRSINWRKKAPPGTITEHAKFRRPIKDCKSQSVTERYGETLIANHGISAVCRWVNELP